MRHEYGLGNDWRGRNTAWREGTGFVSPKALVAVVDSHGQGNFALHEAADSGSRWVLAGIIFVTR